MNWLNRILDKPASKIEPTELNSVEAVIQFYRTLGLFSAIRDESVIQQFRQSHGRYPNPTDPWDDVFLLAYAQGDVWTGDPEADVCAENQVYREVLGEWAAISNGAFDPISIREDWETDTGPVQVSFDLAGRPMKISPAYQNDWIDLKVLQQINALIATSGRQFECAADVNFALVLCLTSEQKQKMRLERSFPFMW
jgi:hypothetical protein